MPYVLVRESLLSAYSTVEGLPSHEAKLLGEKYSALSSFSEDRTRRLELNVASVTLLNSLESLGYSLVTSGAFSAALDSPETFLQREFIWTLHRPARDLCL